METKEIIALILVILLVVGLNSILILALRGKPIRFREFEVLSQAIRLVRNPFQEEAENLEELSRRVSDLKETGEELQPPERN